MSITIPAHLLPADAANKKKTETILTGIFAAWGYTEITTPAVEDLEVLQPGLSGKLLEQSCKFLDARGRIKLLRPDLTTPAAYLAATRLSRQPRPLRLYYCDNVFRAEGQTEFRQAGVELLGAAGDPADTEVLALAADCLQQAGLPEFRVGIGHTGFVEGLLDEAAATEETKEKIRQALNRRDFVGYREIVRAITVPPALKELLHGLPEWHGSADILARAAALTGSPRVQDALRNLAGIYRGMVAGGWDENIYLDLGLVRDLDYYTGIIFEAYTFGLGSPVLGGGRYDNLPGKFGTAMPAVGFAIRVDRLQTALERLGTTGPGQAADCLIVPVAGQETKALLLAKELRRAGGTAEVEITGRERSAAREYARQRGIRKIIIIGADGALTGEEITGGAAECSGVSDVSPLFGMYADEWR